ncbi:hypothetical protein IscW_ISCW003182 [Ixodes scapularis]|uniref:Inosine/uridine-preferring nucleoside hydrolase domain-containing protein n=1 Tax=Ixodes scapularis TaxID=6945 RepID=B7PD03_IXOSC|nr:hypothetical protein IscW_ISCW003182 [Ixodes scapularis]|eukprot:XP_002410513.1 hypothetical protein IscW_ISCW003182 [Ixodes scapularis]
MSRASPLVVLDVDTGVDDAMAIMLARSLGARILAITCVAGNTDLERAYNNTLRVLGLVEETRVLDSWSAALYLAATDKRE